MEILDYPVSETTPSSATATDWGTWFTSSLQSIGSGVTEAVTSFITGIPSSEAEARAMDYETQKAELLLKIQQLQADISLGSTQAQTELLSVQTELKKIENQKFLNMVLLVGGIAAIGVGSFFIIKRLMKK